MTPQKLFTLSLVFAVAAVCITGIASILGLRETVVVLAFEEQPTEQEIHQTLEVLRERINAFGDSLNIRTGKAEYRAPDIVVTLRAYSDVSAFAHILLMTGETKLHLVADDDTIAAIKQGGEVPDEFRRHTIKSETIRITTRKETDVTEEPVILARAPEMVIRKPKAAYFNLRTTYRRPEITIEFNDADSREFAELTRRYTGRTMAVVIEGEVFVAAEIQKEVDGGIVQIHNIANHERARKLYELLRIGALPKPLKVVSIRAPKEREATQSELANTAGNAATN